MKKLQSSEALSRLIWYRKLGLLVFYDGVENERFVAVSTVTLFRIRGCSSKPRRDFSVTRGWQQVMNSLHVLVMPPQELPVSLL